MDNNIYKDVDTGMHCPSCGAPIMITKDKDEYCSYKCGWSLSYDEKISDNP